MKIKKYGLLILLLLLITNVTACASKKTDEESTNLQEETKENMVGNTKNSEAVEENVEEDAEAKAAKDCFQSVLNDFYHNHTFPDGLAIDLEENGDLSENKFAVTDIDGDGKEELILSYTNGAMAGMTEIIYRYDNQKQTVTEELREFPALIYYDNGIIIAEWSHNQGLAGDFWPYTLYRYDNEIDTYVNVAMVDAWNKSLSVTDYDGNPFPEEIDKDGDGIVYYIMRDGEYKLENPVDGAEYEKWFASCIGDGKKESVPYVSLTEENINAIE